MKYLSILSNLSTFKWSGRFRKLLSTYPSILNASNLMCNMYCIHVYTMIQTKTFFVKDRERLSDLTRYELNRVVQREITLNCLPSYQLLVVISYCNIYIVRNGWCAIVSALFQILLHQRRRKSNDLDKSVSFSYQVVYYLLGFTSNYFYLFIA